MGFHAPSAEEVYRHMLRQDGSDALVDGFGFSIVLVNDGSPTSKSFMDRYAEDLCIRTADRIRFIFFSGVSESELQSLASRVIGAKWLQRVMRWAGSDALFDREDEDYRQLRPPHLQPISTADDLEKAIDMWNARLFAMPGTHEAMRFAHMLGIGQHVPCIVAFSEVGALSVKVLRLEDKPLEASYRIVRSWIDDFYEENRATIQSWRDKEEEIRNLARSASTSLYSIREWRREQASRWDEARSIAGVLQRVEGSDWTDWSGVTSDQDPSSVRRFLSKEIQELRRLQRDATLFDEWMELKVSIRAASSADLLVQISARAESLTEALERSTPRTRRTYESIRSGLHESLHSAFGGVDRWIRQCLIWRSKFSRSRFKSDKHDWRELGIEAGAAFRRVLDYVRRQPVTSESPDVGSGALENLAAVINVQVEDGTRWLLLREHYQTAIEAYHSSIKVAAIDNFSDVEGLLLGDVVPTNRHLSQMDISGILSEYPKLRELVRESSDVVDEFRARLLAEVSGLETLNPVDAEQRLKIRASSVLERLRQWGFAAVVACASADHGASKVKRPPDAETLLALFQALDEYRGAVESLVFPFDRDRASHRVPLQQSLADVSGIALKNPAAEAARSARARVEEAMQNVRRFPDELEQALGQTRTKSPVSRFEAALNDGLTKERLDEVWGKSGNSEVDQVRHVLAVLRTLTENERVAVAKALNPLLASDGFVSTQQLEVELAVFSTTMPENEQDVAWKTYSAEFDVFITYNSSDRDHVVDLRERLCAEGLRPWLDVIDGRPGSWIVDMLQEVVRTTRASLICLGADGIGRWQSVEVKALFGESVTRGVRLIPVLLPGSLGIPDSLPFLASLSHVDLTAGVGASGRQIARLVKELHSPRSNGLKWWRLW